MADTDWRGRVDDDVDDDDDDEGDSAFGGGDEPITRYFQHVWAQHADAYTDPMNPLSVDALLRAAARQGGCCAVTQLPMVMQLADGPPLTPYSAVPNNGRAKVRGKAGVTLVCQFVRSMQGGMGDQELQVFARVISRMRAPR